MSDVSANLSMPYIQPSQAQKHVTHNEAILMLDALVQLTVASKDQTTPPGTPINGESYILPAGVTGVWAAHDGKLAIWQDNAWAFYTPNEGWTAWVADLDQFWVFDGTDWVDAAPPQDFQNIPMFGVNTTADANNRLAVASPATLLNHEGAGHQLKINKNAVTDTASLLFQANWSGRAEMGLAGSDNFEIKVSDDGATFRQAMVADAATGAVRFPFGLASPAGTHAPTGVISASVAAPPATPVEGDRYIVASGATGGWAGWDDSVAVFSSGAWLRLIPETGWQVLDETPQEMLMWDGSVWITLDVGLWHPRRLFQGGDVGVLYLPSPATCWQDSARTIQGAMNMPVGAIDDLSGNGNHALQATAAHRPMLRVDVGGFWYLEFDGVDDFMPFSPVPGDITTLAAALRLRTGTRYKVAAFIHRHALYASLTSNTWGGHNTGDVASSYSVVDKSVVVMRSHAANNVDLFTNSNTMENVTTGISYNDRPSSLNTPTSSQNAALNLYAFIAISRAASDSEVEQIQRYMARRSGVTL